MKRTLLVAAGVAALVVTAPAAASYTYFDFARQSNAASTLTMVWQQVPGKFSTVSWRAGSGTSTDACWIGHGWLPTGWYDLRGHWDNYDGTIKGRVFYLQNKQCWNGTWRTELFVHSEETAAQGQYCPTAGDDPYCWDADYDYFSNGCVKLSRAGYPSDLRLMHDGWHTKSADYRHGSFWIDDWLYVHD
jgi:hypothetical protein